jgi:hypothetical protein
MKVDTDEFRVAHSNHETRLYTKKDFANFFDEENNPRTSIENDQVYAKAIKNKLSKNFADKGRVGYSYYVKAQPNKVLYDPTQLHTIEPQLGRSFLNKICKSELMFLEVSESVFSKYLSFLKTSNHQWLTEAQREVK